MSRLSGKTEIVYEPDTDIKIEECKLEPTDTDGDAIAGGEDIDPLNTDQESQGIFETKIKPKQYNGMDIISCELCEFKGLEKGIAIHKKQKHEGIRYPCDLCDYAVTDQRNLKRLIDSKHEGIRYPCDQCKYAATTQGDPKRHKKYKHEGIRIDTNNQDMKRSDIHVISVNIQDHSLHCIITKNLRMKGSGTPVTSVNMLKKVS